MEAILGILDKAKEPPLRELGDSTLTADIETMDTNLNQWSDESICNMQGCERKRIAALLKLYDVLAHVLHFVKPALIASASLRMVQLTLSNGLTPASPLAFAYFGETLVSVGKLNEGCRLGE